MFPAKAIPRPYPVEGCSGWSLKRTDTRVHLCNSPIRDTVVIMYEGNLSHSRCPLCDMLVTWRALNGTHQHTLQRKDGAYSKQQSLAAEEKRKVTTKEFSAYCLPLKMVNSFQYLSCMILPED